MSIKKLGDGLIPPRNRVIGINDNKKAVIQALEGSTRRYDETYQIFNSYSFLSNENSFRLDKLNHNKDGIKKLRLA